MQAIPEAIRAIARENPGLILLEACGSTFIEQGEHAGYIGPYLACGHCSKPCGIKRFNIESHFKRKHGDQQLSEGEPHVINGRFAGNWKLSVPFAELEKLTSSLHGTAQHSVDTISGEAGKDDVTYEPEAAPSQVASISQAFSNLHYARRVAQNHMRAGAELLSVAAHHGFTHSDIEILQSSGLAAMITQWSNVRGASRRAWSRLMDFALTTMKSALKQLLAGSEKFVAIIDEATCRHYKSGTGVAAVLLSTSVSKSPLLIGMVPMKESMNGANVKNIIMQTLQEYDISMDRIIGLMSDNASYMINAAHHHLRIPHMSCLAHDLHLICKCLIEHLPGAKAAIAGVHHFFNCGSNKRIESLRQLTAKRGDADILLGCIESRWNTYIDAARLLSDVKVLTRIANFIEVEDGRSSVPQLLRSFDTFASLNFLSWFASSVATTLTVCCADRPSPVKVLKRINALFDLLTNLQSFQCQDSSHPHYSGMFVVDDGWNIVAAACPDEDEPLAASSIEGELAREAAEQHGLLDETQLEDPSVAAPSAVYRNSMGHPAASSFLPPSARQALQTAAANGTSLGMQEIHAEGGSSLVAASKRLRLVPELQHAIQQTSLWTEQDRLTSNAWRRQDTSHAAVAANDASPSTGISVDAHKAKLNAQRVKVARVLARHAAELDQLVLEDVLRLTGGAVDDSLIGSIDVLTLFANAVTVRTGKAVAGLPSQHAKFGQYLPVKYMEFVRSAATAVKEALARFVHVKRTLPWLQFAEVFDVSNELSFEKSAARLKEFAEHCNVQQPSIDACAELRQWASLSPTERINAFGITVADTDSSMFEIWKATGCASLAYPNLASFAQLALCLLFTSVSAERSFAQARPRLQNRGRLTPNSFLFEMMAAVNGTDAFEAVLKVWQQELPR